MAEENRGTYEGSCFCGAVRYEVKGPIGPMSNCFCTDCRRSHAAPLSTFIDALKANFRFVKGEDQLNTYLAESGAKRSFCRNCGSILICFNDANPKTMEIHRGHAGDAHGPQARVPHLRPQQGALVRHPGRQAAAPDHALRRHQASEALRPPPRPSPPPFLPAHPRSPRTEDRRASLGISPVALGGR